MIRFGFDSETFPIRPGRQSPRVVCVQARGTILLREAGLDLLEAVLADPEILIYGHNVAFDACASIATRPRLLPLWLAAYAADRVTCTYEREKLIRIAEGTLPRYPKNGLRDLLRRYKIADPFKDADKDKGSGGVRTSYHLLDGIDPALWPEDARRYALADLVVEDVFAAQETAPAPWLADQFRQARAAFWLYLTKAHGMRVDVRAVREFGDLVEREHGYVRDLLTTAAPEALAQFVAEWNRQHPDAPEPMTPEWVRIPFGGGLVRKLGSKDTKAAKARMRAVCRLKGLPIPLTATGKEHLAAGRDRASLEEEYTSLEADATAATGDPVLIAYSRFVSIGTLRSRVERLRMAGEYGLPIQPTFDTLKETGRTSSTTGEVNPGEELRAFGDQSQNLHRAPGLRECYRAREGCAIWSVDWKAAELNGLAQCCIDLGLDSNLARTINSGKDPHLWFACVLAGWEYTWAEEALKGKHGDAARKKVKAARQGAKACNFGFPGGLGIEKFRLYAAKQYQVHFTEDEARQRKGVWLDAFPEMRGYFAHVTDLCDRGAPLVHFMSGRYRGDVRFTSAANSYFQGRIADMAKHAGWLLTLAIHRDGLPARLWNFAHDEFLGESPLSVAHDVALEVVRIMREAGRVWCPDVPVDAEPALQLSWRKGAEPYYGPDGRLAPWEHRPVSPDVAEKIRKSLAQGDSPLYTSWVYGFTEARILEVAHAGGGAVVGL